MLASWAAIAAALLLGVPAASASLAARVAAAASSGPEHADAMMRLVVAMGWLAAFAVGALSAGAEGFGSRPGRLLVSLPIEHASRFRLLALQAVFGRAGLLLVAMGAVIARAAALGLSPALARELDLFGGGIACAVLGAAGWTAGALLVLAGRGARLRGATLALAAGLPVGAALALARSAAGGVSLAAVPLVVVAAVLLGPGARPAGGLVLAALVAGEARGRGDGRCRRSFFAEQVLSRWREPTGALLYRGYLARLRNPLTYVRIGMLGAAVAAYPAVRLAVGRVGEEVPFLVAYALAAVQLVLHEVTVQAAAGEGNRLALLMQAPWSHAQVLAAKIASTLFPVAIAAVAVTMVLAAVGGATWSVLATAMPSVLLVTAGTTAFLVLGSSLDADLERPVDAPIEAIFADDAPVSPRRLALVVAAVAMQVPCVVLLARAPLWEWLVAMAVVDTAVVTGMMAVARRRLTRLARGDASRTVIG